MSYKHDQRTRDKWARQKRNQRAGRESQPQQSNNQDSGEMDVEDPFAV